jgi:Leucine Rich repeat
MSSNDPVPSLKTMAINVIARHSHWFETFGAIPQDLAEQVLQATFDQDTITAEMMDSFAETYPNSHLSLRHACYMKSIRYQDTNLLDRQLRTLSIVPTFLTKLDLKRCQELTDDDLCRLNPLTSLVTLDLSDTGITDYGVSHLARPFAMKTSQGLWHLEALLVSNVKYMSDASLKYLAKFPALNVLDITGTSIDEDVADIVLTRLGFDKVDKWDDTTKDLITIRPHKNLGAFLVQTSDIGDYRKLYWAVHIGTHVSRDSVIYPTMRPRNIVTSSLKYVRSSRPDVQIPRKRPSSDPTSGPLKLRRSAPKQSLDMLKDLL